eukprot:gene3898-2767_t
MPPKAPPKGGGKKGGNGVPNEKFYEDLRLTDEIAALNLRLSSLKKVFVDRMESTAEKQREHLEAQAQAEKEAAAHREKLEEKTDILADFTRQYKTDEREMIVKITEVDNSVNKLLEEKIRLQKEIEDTEKLYDAKIKEKKQQFDALCQREAEMEREFQAILGDIEEKELTCARKSKQAENCRDVSIPSFVRLSLSHDITVDPVLDEKKRLPIFHQKDKDLKKNHSNHSNPKTHRDPGGRIDGWYPVFTSLRGSHYGNLSVNSSSPLPPLHLIFFSFLLLMLATAYPPNVLVFPQSVGDVYAYSCCKADSIPIPGQTVPCYTLLGPCRSSTSTILSPHQILYTVLMRCRAQLAPSMLWKAPPWDVGQWALRARMMLSNRIFLPVRLAPACLLSPSDGSGDTAAPSPKDCMILKKSSFCSAALHSASLMGSLWSFASATQRTTAPTTDLQTLLCGRNAPALLAELDRLESELRILLEEVSEKGSLGTDRSEGEWRVVHDRERAANGGASPFQRRGSPLDQGLLLEGSALLTAMPESLSNISASLAMAEWVEAVEARITEIQQLLQANTTDWLHNETEREEVSVGLFQEAVGISYALGEVERSQEEMLQQLDSLAHRVRKLELIHSQLQQSSQCSCCYYYYYLLLFIIIACIIPFLNFSYSKYNFRL